jgi:lipoate-protein ligase A
MSTCIRLLPFEIADGPANMAADEALLHTAATEHSASLRLYGWSTATLSLGYFQPHAARGALAALPWVRRASGGATLVHHHELTYCIALPPGPSWQGGEPWLTRMHRNIRAALSELGVDGVELVETPALHGDVLCFQRHTPGDLVCRGAKITGSAQRKHRGALLQHGSILLAASPHAPQLSGIAELSGRAVAHERLAAAIVHAVTSDTGWHVEAWDWNDAETNLRTALASAKYATPAWNERR